MEFKFELDKIINSAKELGVEVKLNSNNPGVFITDKDGNTKKAEFEDIFPELKEELNNDPKREF
ncbi:hypothetical protein [Metabacillus sp. Hm71]|uniref:hypothetical protein n=1 Tax=Metabacillus sp. Hm71 TaxID=3450743 RepID=UPI003F421067